MQQIADSLSCSVNKVKYWMVKYGIKRRSISEAIYIINNPNGDPFNFRLPKTFKEAKLFGLGLGLYWGEGTKANPHAIRLGNTDPRLLKKFIEFLITFFRISKDDLMFGLQLFTDINVEKAKRFWMHEVGTKPSQFYKPTITISGSIGTYRKKSEYGVLTVIYHNRKLRDLLISLLPT